MRGGGCCFGYVGDGLFAGAVDGGEVDDNVAWFEDEVAEDEVEGRRGVDDEDAGVDWGGEVRGDGGTGGVEVLGVCPADPVVGAGFGEVLVGPQGVSDGGWVGAEGAW